MLEDRVNLGVRVRQANRNSMKPRRLYDRAENHVTRIEARVNTSYGISYRPLFALQDRCHLRQYAAKSCARSTLIGRRAP
jgi:hypothetical protein